MFIGNVRNAFWEINEIWKTGYKYFFKYGNYQQGFMVVSTILVTVYTITINVHYGERISIQSQMKDTEDAEQLLELQAHLDQINEEDVITEKHQTMWVSITLLMLLIELPNQLRIFDFFSPFVRALEETVYDSG